MVLVFPSLCIYNFKKYRNLKVVEHGTRLFPEKTVTEFELGKSKEDIIIKSIQSRECNIAKSRHPVPMYKGRFTMQHAVVEHCYV